MAQHAGLLAIVRKLVGSDVRMIQDMALLKPPRVGREKPWHQDAAYFLYEPIDRIIGTWTALDEATAQNGCMHVLPGTHLLGPQAHYHDRDCQLPDDAVDVERDVIVPLRPGGVLFFAALLHHGTPPNRSPSRRRAVQLHYASVDCVKIDDARHAEIFRDGAGYAGCGMSADQKPRPVSQRVI
jgi:phytanoyl-CoA hydroxylase